jgi:competence ComEA-like helix-hairpin-helix protein
MGVWTPGERRGALLVVFLLLLGAARDLWRATHPVRAPSPVDRPVAAGERAGAAGDGGGYARRDDRAPAAAPVDLNRAGPAELDALPGIGPVLAERIIRHRGAHGPFHEPEDLLAVPGIGPRLLERLRARVRAGPVRDSAARAAAPAPREVAIGNSASRVRVQIPVQAGRPPGR